MLGSRLICNKKGYIDPGTGGMIIGNAIWPWIAAVLAAIGGFFVKFFWHPIKRGVSRLWKKKE